MSKNYKNLSLEELMLAIGYTDKNTTHVYDSFYGPLLSHKKESATHVLEIGVSYFGGGDLAALGYYFGNAKVFGVDLVPCRIPMPSNVKVIKGDGYDTSFLDTTFNNISWDIVLDDGPHTKESQLIFLNYFYNKLKVNGILLIEDIWPDSIDYILNNFKGNPKYLSLVNRLHIPRGVASNGKTCINEYVIMYMPGEN
ncbi:class I SAM-dependent methyltransferase [Candidatus Woesearchaeota archaeon]|jgi:hypothetical protein|nr:class I SAM-dependent methyltransferase [Candidatus Woesearchaeota archaeon]